MAPGPHGRTGRRDLRGYVASTTRTGLPGCHASSPVNVTWVLPPLRPAGATGGDGYRFAVDVVVDSQIGARSLIAGVHDSAIDCEFAVVLPDRVLAQQPVPRAQLV